MEDKIDLVMRVGTENEHATISKGELKIKKNSLIKNTTKLNLTEIINEFIMPNMSLISLRDLSVLINGLIIIYYMQQMSINSKIQDIHNTLVCPNLTENLDPPNQRQSSRRNNGQNQRTRRRANPENVQFLTNLSKLLSRRHFLMLNQDMSSYSSNNSVRK